VYKQKQGFKICRVHVYLAELAAAGFMQLHQDSKVTIASSGTASTKGSLIIQSCDHRGVRVPFVVRGPRNPPSFCLDPETSPWCAQVETPGAQTNDFAEFVFERVHLSAVGMCPPIAGSTDYLPLTKDDLNILVQNDMR